MPAQQTPDATLRDALAAVERHGGVAQAARALGVSRETLKSRVQLARARGIGAEPVAEQREWTYPAQVDLDVRGGTVLVGSDLHAWPGQRPVAWGAFVRVAEMVQPRAIIFAGDGIDGTRISRHPRLRNQDPPSVSDEVAACVRLFSMLPEADYRVWTLGNHDLRIDGYLANMATEMADWGGSLTDRFPEWQFTYGATINGNTEVRHTFRSGIHAAWNTTLHLGVSSATGHTHQLDLKSFVDRRGRRYGVELGMLNDPMAPQFEYSQGAATRWAAGFAVMTFDRDGTLLRPEICEVVNGRAVFRGEEVFSKPRVRVKAAAA